MKLEPDGNAHILRLKAPRTLNRPAKDITLSPG
jgi:hypothetical protein